MLIKKQEKSLKVLITGAGGFLGTTLTEQLIQKGELCHEGHICRIKEMLLVDRDDFNLGSTPNIHGIKIQLRCADLAQAPQVTDIMSFEPDVIFHLAATLTLAAEMNNDQAFGLNVGCLHQIIESASPNCRLIFSSSIAVFGNDLPKTVDDSIRPSPNTTYGTHKAMAELMLADATRKGKLNARSVRLPIVLIRDASPSPTVSDLVASILREPLAGTDIECGLEPTTKMPVASVSAVAKALIALHDVSDGLLPAGRVFNLPSLTITPAEMVDALSRLTNSRSVGNVTFKPNTNLQAIVDGWPRELTSAFALRCGIKADNRIDNIIEDYLIRQHKWQA